MEPENEHIWSRNLQIVLAVLMTAAVLLIPVTGVYTDSKEKRDNYGKLLENAIAENMPNEYIDSIRGYEVIYTDKTLSAALSLIFLVFATFSSIFEIMLFLSGEITILVRWKIKIGVKRIKSLTGFTLWFTMFAFACLVGAILDLSMAITAFILAAIGVIIVVLTTRE